MRASQRICQQPIGLLFGVLALGIPTHISAQTCNPTETQKLTPSDGEAGDNFGSSAAVAIDGDTLLVGSRYHIGTFFEDGAAYVYRDSGSGWVEEQKLVASDGDEGDWFGWAVGLEGDTAMVGSFLDDDLGEDSGSVYVYEHDGTSWVEAQKLLASDGTAGAFFGRQIEIRGDLAIIGAWTADVEDVVAAGKTYIFRHDGASWVEEAVLSSSEPSGGAGFGGWVTIQGDTAIIGEPYADGDESSAGAAYVFEYDGSSWNQTQRLTPPVGEWTNGVFGNSVQVSGDTLVVGSVYEDNFTGAAYVYRYDGTEWVFEQKLTASDARPMHLFGYVTIQDDVIVIGARWDDDEADNAGAAYVFQHDGTQWQETHKLTASAPEASDQFGWAVAISGNTLAISAMSDNSLAADAGAVYMFDLGCTSPCVADTNHDGILSPADFSAWIAAFNAHAPECDQNADGACTPADFTAWIANYNAGC